MRYSKEDFENKKKNDNKIKFWISNRKESNLKHILDSTPIVPANQHIPDWWKKVPAHALGSPGEPIAEEHVEKVQSGELLVSGPSFVCPGHITNEDKTRNTGTIKLCPAIHDWFDMGYVLPMWCDMEINIVDDGKGGESGPKPYDLRTPSAKFQGSLMDNITYIHWLPEEYRDRGAVGFIHLDVPWSMSTPPGISVYQMPMYYHFNPDFEVPPGPIWTDEYSRVNPQIIVKHYGKFTIKRGTPICVFVPYIRDAELYGRTSLDDLELELVRYPGEHEEIHEGKSEAIIDTYFRGGYRKMQLAKEK